jgi:hypothetical protein
VDYQPTSTRQQRLKQPHANGPQSRIIAPHLLAICIPTHAISTSVREPTSQHGVNQISRSKSYGNQIQLHSKKQQVQDFATYVLLKE